MESLIEELKADLQWRDEEFNEAREERDRLKADNERLRKLYQEENAKRQCLEATKWKYTALKELTDNAGPIQDQTFFDNKRNRNQAAGQGGNFMN